MPLTLNEVSYTYPGAFGPTVDRLSLSVSTGESVAIMAPSGSGKSTLLALAGGTVRPSSGSRTLSSGSGTLPPTVSWVFQAVNLLARRSAIDNVVLPALARGEDRWGAEARGRQLLEELGLSSIADQNANTLSGGEAQRVGVARSLITGPDLLLADEPTANLDTFNALMVAEYLFRTTRTTAFIVATHDLRVAQMADSIVRLDRRDE